MAVPNFLCLLRALTELSAAIRQYWSTFSKTGVPSSKGNPNWPKYNATGGHAVAMGLSTPIAVLGDFRNELCRFWETVMPNPP